MLETHNVCVDQRFVGGVLVGGVVVSVVCEGGGFTTCAPGNGGPRTIPCTA